MVYGLFRADVLAKCGVYSTFAGPDRLLLLEVSLYGSYKQIPRELWFRRYPGRQPNPAGGVPSDFEQVLDRQQVTLYEDGKAPWYSHSMILGHALGLICHLCLCPPSGSYANSHLGPYMACLHIYTDRKFIKAEIKRFFRHLKRNPKVKTHNTK